MQKSETRESSKNLANKWLGIMNGGGDLQERLTATYTEVMRPETFGLYKPRSFAVPPKGYHEDYMALKTMSVEKQSEGWKKFREKYSGYFKHKEENESQNISDVKFLEEVLTHFEKLGITSYTSMIRDRLRNYAEVMR